MAAAVHLTVSDVADALEDCTRTRSLKAKQQVLRELFTKCGSDAASFDMLLRVLLPGEVIIIARCCTVVKFRQLRCLLLVSAMMPMMNLSMSWPTTPVVANDALPPARRDKE